MVIALALVVSSLTSCGTRPAEGDGPPANYVFFRRDHDRIRDREFLANPGITGAQLTFTWRELEPERDRYDFRALHEQLAFLRAHDRALFLQIQDVSFSDSILTPEYLRSDSAFHGGVAAKYDRGQGGRPRFDGWVARRWDPAVRSRFARLLDTLAREFDGQLEGIVLAETAVSFDYPAGPPAGFSHEAYASGVREMMSAARQAFRRSCVVIYANFMPGEWLPENDRGYLRSVHAHAERIGVGVGGPDILPSRRGQRKHSLPLIAERRPDVVAAMAVQDGNLAERSVTTGRPVTVKELYDYADRELRLDYIFWGTEEPYYSAAVLPFLRDLASR